MTNSHSIGRQNKRSLYRQSVGAGLLAVCVLALGSLSHANGLTPKQQTQARSLAAQVPWPAQASPRRHHPLGLQTLSIEKQERKNHPEVRRVHVYQYHYGHRGARLLVIDLNDDTIEKQHRIESVHLPLNSAEITYAQALIVQNPTVLQRLHDEQHQRGQHLTTDLSELDVKASIYEPTSALHVCHSQRCALFSLFDSTRTVFAVEPVVLLDTLQVQLLEQP